MPNMPFRLVALTHSAPYPLPESQAPAEQSHMIDLLSGERFHRTSSIHQPVAEDFFRPQHLYPAPPVEVHDSDQCLDIIEPTEENASDQHILIIEPDSEQYFPSIYANTHHTLRPYSAGAVDLGRSDTIATSKPLDLNTRVADPKRSKSAADVPEAADSQHGEIPAMGADMFSPALGGLHRLPTAPPRRLSRLGRIKRFFSLKNRRQYGRVTR